MYGGNRRSITSVASMGSSNRSKHWSHEPSDKTVKMRRLIDGLLMHIKAFDGDVYGGTVRDYKTLGLVYVKDINCRIDSMMFTVFLQTLHLHYKVRDMPSEIGGKFVDYVKKLYITFKEDDNDVYTYLHIIVISKLEWLSLPCDFDINLLAENATSLYIRSSYVTMNKFVDKLGYVTDRIKRNVFAQVEPLAGKLPDHKIHLMDRAFKLSVRGWTMDDAVLGQDAYVMNTWIMVKNVPNFVRKEYNEHQKELMTNMDECSICSEKFKDGDVVINTTCNHNFHWTLLGCNRSNSGSSSSCKGLREWIQLDNVTCPLCRKVMF